MKHLQNKFPYLVLLLLNCFPLSCSKSGADNPEIVVPSIKVANASQSRSTVQSVMQVQLTLSKTTRIPVPVNYTLKDGTAIADKDYAAASGTTTVPANKTIAMLSHKECSLIMYEFSNNIFNFSKNYSLCFSKKHILIFYLL